MAPCTQTVTPCFKRMRWAALAAGSLLLLASLQGSAATPQPPPPQEQQQPSEEAARESSEPPPERNATTCKVSQEEELKLKLAGMAAVAEAKRRRLEPHRPLTVSHNMVLTEGASLGVRTLRPQAALHVNGTAKLKQLVLESGGGPADGAADDAEAATCSEVRDTRVRSCGARAWARCCSAQLPGQRARASVRLWHVGG